MRERLRATPRISSPICATLPAWRNCLIAELPNGDFAFSIARLLLVTAFTDPFWRAAVNSTDSTISAIAAKAEKETAYHLRHAAEWLIRLGDGTAGKSSPRTDGAE